MNESRAGLEQAAGPLMSGEDLHWFHEGTHVRLYRKLGAHQQVREGVAGAQFGVWAPHAEHVSVIGDFNGWNADAHPLERHGDTGLWGGFVPRVREAAAYKYHLVSQADGAAFDKADPMGFWHELPPQTASLVWDLGYEWHDGEWMRARGGRLQPHRPVSIYEVHLGSWMRVPEESNRFLTYREIAPKLAEYAQRLGFTHVEFLPLMEHPFYASWGYQTTGYFAPTSRYGMPQDLMFLIDFLHQQGIGVILDWVPSHFPADPHGLARFDGAPLYEYADPRLGFHPEWNSYLFDYGRPEVRSFLLSSALFWLEHYHADGLRVDAVATMLYRDHMRGGREWVPNEFGGRENLEAVGFLRQLNEAVYRHYPDVQTVAEESTAWPMVSRPTYVGGLGFGYKWDMGFTHDVLRFLSRAPAERRFHYEELTFRGLYAFDENFVLPLSHDDVKPGKGSLLARLPGDEAQQFAQLRLLLAYLFLQPGKKLLFMGNEFGQRREWNHDASLDWHLIREPPFAGIQRLVTDLNRLYRECPALHEGDTVRGGFEWIDCHDTDQATISWLRRGTTADEVILGVFNFTAAWHQNFKLGVPAGGHWREVFNSDAREYGGQGRGNFGGVEALPFGWHGRPHSLNLTLPPFGAVAFTQ